LAQKDLASAVSLLRKQIVKSRLRDVSGDCATLNSVREFWGIVLWLLFKEGGMK
jgi:hypothetical protein